MPYSAREPNEGIWFMEMSFAERAESDRAGHREPSVRVGLKGNPDIMFTSEVGYLLLLLNKDGTRALPAEYNKMCQPLRARCKS